tara:strand:- start:13 stop:675 length:663 start_codon:yes stop_codon:yes gene_type:complete
LKSGFQEKAQQSQEDFRLSFVITTKPPGSESLDSSEDRSSLGPREIKNASPEESILENVTSKSYETIAEFSSSRNQNAIFNSGEGLSKDQAKAAIIQLASSAETQSPRSRKILNKNYLTSSEESYLRAWRKKCEDLGRRNYPPKNIEGRATTRVVISRNGNLIKASIIKTSGSSLIDKAILKTINQASPFQPFNTDMSKKYDVIEFERIWQFSKTKQIIY